MSVQFYVDIEKILERKNMTLGELAKKTGIQKASLSRMKKTKKVTFSTLNRIANSLGETDWEGLVSAEFKSSGKIIR
ncbi:helix-turn-helix domain-containing protein [Bacillus licheniformis]|uniref:helix-turn-helix domain-containing protein n=1 Tax=Bacillus licheniformis TaxID=1402 RepID=UPI00115CEC8F|nr:helix-turn-helix transcriptional regulator [Bacillus licheniformis]MDH3162337.1 helix-turn-helix transcriptional regulator [Bacillus licheniformis]MED4409023.1 helix-turn-helix transcriptional regulator [Bacillus licheniformis]QDL76922.1 XRE family transcriptional regulator [Bacillus licheniformis]